MADAYLLESGGTDNYLLEDGTGNYLLDAPFLALHLDASAISGPGDGSPLDTWTDLSGFGNDANQSTPGAKPTYQTFEIGGLGIVRFDGTDDTMLVTHDATLSCTDWTIFIVAKASAVAGNDQAGIVEKWAGGGPYTYAVRSNNSGVNVGVSVFDGTDFGASSASAPGADTPFVITGRRSTPEDNVRVWANQTEAGDSPATDATTASILNAVDVGIGSRGGVGPFFAGDIAEVQFWNGALTTGEITTIEDALILKWLTGVTIQPPTIAGTTTLAAPTVQGDAELELPDPIELIASLPQPAIQIQPATQKARPDADQSIGTWTTDSGGTTNLWDSLNETSASDADYVKSATTPTNNEVIFTLTNIGDPEASGGHLVRFRYRKT